MPAAELLGTDPMANIGVMVSQELPYPGKRDARAAVASIEAQAEFQQIRTARLTVTSRVKQAYYALSYADAAGAVLERDLAIGKVVRQRSTSPVAPIS